MKLFYRKLKEARKQQKKKRRLDEEPGEELHPAAGDADPDSTGEPKRKRSTSNVHRLIESIVGGRSADAPDERGSSKKSKPAQDSQDEQRALAEAAAAESSESAAWSAPLQEEKTKDDEYDEYFQGLLF
jgi:hypothetical protein